jgi:hypothetical protein
MRLALALCLVGSAARAQSLDPMRGEVTSFAERFAVQVFPGNPYNRTMPIEVRVYDDYYRPLAAIITPQSAIYGAGVKRRVLVIVPFDGVQTRTIRVCAESNPLDRGQTRLRTQVCGRFVARRLG